jgi:hypothetical protein
MKIINLINQETSKLFNEVFIKGFCLHRVKKAVSPNRVYRVFRIFINVVSSVHRL